MYMRTKLRLYLVGILTACTLHLSSQVVKPNFEEPIKLDALNSDGEESMPLPYLNGENIYFVRTYIDGKAKQRKKAQEVWASERESGSWSEPHSLFEEVNDLGNNGVIGTSTDGNTVYVFNSIQTRRKLAKGIAYTQKAEDGTWTDLKKLEIEGFEAGEGYYSFYMSPKEDVLLVSMSPNDTTIAEDLFVSQKGSDGKWSALKNLGSTINTSDVELSPYIADDGKTLYFSSTGHGGLGNADIFMSYRQDDSWENWTKPVNLGSPINSDAFDAYFIIGNNKEVYFVSNRNQKYSDIYYTKIDEMSVAPISSTVIAEFKYEGRAAKGVALELYDTQGNLIDEVVTDEDGHFTYDKLKADEIFTAKLKDEPTSNYLGSKIYLQDENGHRLKRLVLIEDGVFTDESVDTKMIEGVFEYNELPMQNAGLIVLDENGFPLDTIYTDSEGKFQYFKMELDEDYSIKPMNVDDVKLEGVDLYLTDDAGDRVSDSEPNHEKAFVFGGADKEVADVSKTEEPAKKQVPQKPQKPAKKEEAKSEMPVKAKPMASNILMIYFDFNDWLLSQDDKEKLEGAVKKMQSDQNIKATLTGHTDDVGTSRNNLRVSIYRVRAARAYMMERGIAKSRITIYGMGEVQPKESNKTEEGRAKNRRVEVVLN